MTHVTLYKSVTGRICYRNGNFVGHKTWGSLASAIRRMKQIGWTYEIQN